MTEARNHHFISQTYLRGFTHNGGKNSKLFTIDLVGATCFETSPRNVGAQRDFNYIDGLPHGALENALGRFESTVGSSIKAISQARTLSDRQSLIDVLNLSCLFAVRNPRMRETVRRFHEQTANLIMEIALATPERWESQVRQMVKAGVWDQAPDVPYERLRQVHKAGGYRVEVPTTRHIQMELKVFGEVLGYFVARKWMLCTAAPGSGGFITTDHPVCLMWSEGEAASFQRPAGYGCARTTILFPLTSELLMIGTFEGESGERELSPWQVAFFNGVLVGYAERQAYATDGRVKMLVSGRETPIMLSELPAHLHK